ncbi:condensation domain-containing protein [Kitasatospora sp. NPDC085895]|uniref:condensation domain-containing protein n=1 Tax=Kitasatospora sp. NPDC085895 TaxID=3155057 RepID=UPI00344F7E13
MTIRMESRLRRFGLNNDDRRRTMTLSLSHVFTGADLDVERLRAALGCVSDRHPALRTRFRLVEGGDPEQSVLPEGEVDVPLEIVRCRPLSSDGAPTAEAREHLQRETERSFDLSSGALLRGQLLTDSENSHIVTLSADHIVSDGISAELMMADLVSAYVDPEAFRNKQPEFPQGTLIEFAAYQRDLVGGARGEALLRAWTERLPNGVPEMVVPRDFDTSERTNDGGRLTTVVGPGGHRDMRQRMRELRASPFVLAGAGLLAEFRRMGADGDLSFMTPCAGRPIDGFEDTVGNFTNVLPLVVPGPRTDDFAGLVRQVRSGAAWLLDHQEIPFASIVEAADPSSSPFPHERAQVFLSFQTRQTPRLAGMTGSEIGPDHVDALFDMSLWVTDLGNRLLIDLVYRRLLFDGATAERVMAAVVHALTGHR